MSHYTAYELDLFRNGELNWSRRWLLCRLHLRCCHRCRERLSRLEQDDLLILELRKSEDFMKIPENPLVYRRLCDIFQTNSRKEHKSAE